MNLEEVEKQRESAMSRDELLRELSGVSELIEARPWWQKNLLDEYYKSTSDTPRPRRFCEP
jgi:hypothetical protein